MEATFDDIMEREEQLALTRRLQREYPAWQRRRRVGLGAVASVAVLMAAGITVLNSQFPIPTGYDSVVCNRSGIADAHWAAVASNVLAKSHTL